MKNTIKNALTFIGVGLAAGVAIGIPALVGVIAKSIDRHSYVSENIRLHSNTGREFDETYHGKNKEEGRIDD